LLRNFKAHYPHLEIILEPGAAFVWETGYLVATVLDITENHGIKTAMLDVSFTAHMPDCLEMPYKPVILGAIDEKEGMPTYRMGGNSCLAGDYMGNWSFDHELAIGEKIVFNDMIHYTIVKTTMFNGVRHPHIGMWTRSGQFQLFRTFDYSDYKNRMC
jgi:carboxynorspermidine decarboxylase